MYWRRTLLSLLAIFVLLVGPSVVMVEAAYVQSAMVNHPQSFDRAENNHSYVYTEGPPLNFYTNSFLTHEEDLNFAWYGYQSNSWQRSTDTYPGPAERRFNLAASYIGDWGLLQENVWLPTFYDFWTDEPDSEIGSESSYSVFPITVDVQQSLIMESRYVYIGTFNATDEEFFHLTVTSHQDGLTCGWDIYDYEFRWLTSGDLQDSDIEVSPFKSSGSGTYYLIVDMYSDDPAPVVFDFLVESVVPETIVFGEVVEGLLPGSEVRSDDENDGAWVTEQIRPNAHTYKFSSNSTQFGRLSVLFENYGGLFLSYNTRASVTGCLFEGSYEDYAFWYDLGVPSDVFYYTSYANETYYVTVQGMDNTGFTLINQMVDVPVLPMNEEFFIESWESEFTIKPYHLSLGQDSVMRVNRTEWGSGFHWTFMTVTSDGYYEDFAISEGATFEGASSYYLPAGNYLMLARSESIGTQGLYEFNFGPVLDGAGGVAVEVDRLIGMRVPVENLMFYRSNITLLTHDNVTVDAEIDYMNTYGMLVYGVTAQLGNRQSGTSWEAFGANTTSLELGLSTTSYGMFCDGDVIIVVAPYRLRNNTAGISNDLFGRTVDMEISFDEDEERILHATETVAVGSEFVWTNFTLDEFGDANELYGLRITGAEGVWMNFSILTEDVTSWFAYAYQDFEGCPQKLDWSELDDTFIGDATDGAFEMGGISGDILLVFDIQRVLSAEGLFAIGITPYDAYNLTFLPVPSYYAYGAVPGPLGAGIDPVLAIVGIGIVAVVVVVVVVVLKKRGTI